MKPHYKLGLDGSVAPAQPTLGMLRAKALAGLRSAGISVPGWARANGFKPSTVKALLYGHSRGQSGEAHRAAIALGLKSGSVVSTAGFAPARASIAEAQQ